MPVSIVSHSHMVREVLRTACRQRDIEVAHVCDTCNALEYLGSGDLVALHTGRAIDDVTEQLMHLRSLEVPLRIVLISPQSSIDDIRTIFAASVDAIMSEDTPTDALIGMLAVVSQGYRIVYAPDGELAPLTMPTQDGAPAALDREKPKASPHQDWVLRKARVPLSPRETAVLEQLRDGGSNKDIANALGICEATVKVYLRTCFQKIGVKNRTQAAVWAAERL